MQAGVQLPTDAVYTFPAGLLRAIRKTTTMFFIQGLLLMRDDFNNNADTDYFISTNHDGDRTWWLHGVRHRHDGPAEELADGTKIWWHEGRKHRVDGPAEVRADGSRIWWFNDEKHRLDGPAEENADGSTTWWRNGQKHRDDGPAHEGEGGALKIWYRHGKEHRDDGPAMVFGELKWWKQNGKLHREDGPAFEHPDPAYNEWYIDGIKLTPAEVAEREAALLQREVQVITAVFARGSFGGLAAPVTARFKSRKALSAG